METTTLKTLIKKDILGFTVPLLIGTILLMTSLKFSNEKLDLGQLSELSPELMFTVFGFFTAFLISNKATVEPTTNKQTIVAFNSIYRVCYSILFIGIISFFSFIPFWGLTHYFISIFIAAIAFFVWGIGRVTDLTQGELKKDKDLLSQLEDSDSEKVARSIFICAILCLIFTISAHLNAAYPESFKNYLKSQTLSIFFSMGLTFGALIVKINSINKDYDVKEVD